MHYRTVLLVENESLLRDLIAQTLETNNFQVVSAGNVAQAKAALQSLDHDPDAVVVDIDLGAGPNGFDLADYLQRQCPGIGVVFLTNIPDPRFMGRDKRSVQSNAAYLRKSQLLNTTDFIHALEAILRDRASVRWRHDLDSTRPLASLSRKQLGVLSLVSQGLSNGQIASSRGTSIRAVESMISRVFEALNIDTAADGNARVEAARTYIRASGSIGN